MIVHMINSIILNHLSKNLALHLYCCRHRHVKLVFTFNPSAPDDELSRVYALCDLTLTSYLAKIMLSVQKSVHLSVTQSSFNVSKVDTSAYRSRPQLSNAILEVIL